jgi:polysaccharide biosynthesis/export protein
MGHAEIVRPTANGKSLTIPLNLNKIMKNETQDVALEAGDILVIPRSGWKTFGMSAFPALVGAGAGAAAVSIEPR